VATSAAVALGLAAKRKAACQQRRCQHANHCSHWTSHRLNRKENATSRQKSHYFFSPGLYTGAPWHCHRGLLPLPASEARGEGRGEGHKRNGSRRRVLSGVTASSPQPSPPKEARESPRLVALSSCAHYTLAGKRAWLSNAHHHQGPDKTGGFRGPKSHTS
jgi:hypothetical protein